MLEESKRRIVITGLGVLSPVGIGKDAFWSSLMQGHSGIAPLTRFDPSSFASRIAGEVKDFSPEQYLDRKEIKRMDRCTQFAVAAARLAIEDSGLELEGEDLEKIGVVMGTGIGGIETLCDQHIILLDKGPEPGQPPVHTDDNLQYGGRSNSYLPGAKGPEHYRGHSLRFRYECGGRGVPDTSAG